VVVAEIATTTLRGAMKGKTQNNITGVYNLEKEAKKTRPKTNINCPTRSSYRLKYQRPTKGNPQSTMKANKTNQKEKIVCIKAQPMKFYSKAVL